MSEQEREKQYQAYIDYAIEIYRDMIPYDDPDYEYKLLEAAKSYADMEMNGYQFPPELEEWSKEQDRLREAGQLDYHDILPF